MTKIHVVVDAQGLPSGSASPQARRNGQIVNRLLDHFGPRTIMRADKAYYAHRNRELIQNGGIT